ncbi:MAG: hypothetical protein IJ424_00725 [Oscillospiraceae bacterium]|nr:hypothetical protein [Oscillospiraceae bacterium]
MNIYVLGLDKRTAYCAAVLKESFKTGVILCDNAQCIYQPDVVVLPYVSFKKGRGINTLDGVDIKDVIEKMPAGSKLFAGMIYDGFKEECEEKDIKLYDFFEDEDLTLKNADLTAEGALELIIKNTDIALEGMNVAITGFGRVARSCARILNAVGAKIAVLARKPYARMEAKSLGYNSANISDEKAIESADVIINTVPSLVLTSQMIKNAKNCRYILDLASAPYGTDFEAAEKAGIKAETAPGLPARCAPETAGRMIAKYITDELKRGGE